MKTTIITVDYNKYEWEYIKQVLSVAGFEIRDLNSWSSAPNVAACINQPLGKTLTNMSDMLLNTLPSQFNDTCVRKCNNVHDFLISALVESGYSVRSMQDVIYIYNIKTLNELEEGDYVSMKDTAANYEYTLKTVVKVIDGKKWLIPVEPASDYKYDLNEFTPYTMSRVATYGMKYIYKIYNSKNEVKWDKSKEEAKGIYIKLSKSDIAELLNVDENILKII